MLFGWIRRIGEILLRRQKRVRCDLVKIDATIEKLRKEKHELADRSQVIMMEAYGHNNKHSPGAKP